MDPHQHKNDELQHNDLAWFLTHFNEWWTQHGSKVTFAILLVAVVLAGWYWLSVNARAGQEQAWGELARAEEPQTLLSISGRYARSRPVVGALADLRAADLLLDQAVRGEALEPAAHQHEEGEDPAAHAPTKLTAEQRSAMLEQASQTYWRLAEATRDRPVLRLNALLGLASVNEARGEMETAKFHYLEVILETEEEAGRYAALRAQAQQRLDLLDRLSRPVTFAPAAAPAPVPGAAVPAGPGNGLQIINGQTVPDLLRDLAEQPEVQDSAGGEDASVPAPVEEPAEPVIPSESAESTEPAEPSADQLQEQPAGSVETPADQPADSVATPAGQPAAPAETPIP